mgnify:CR=1 FL=1|tara:strand:+ start:148 stop:570 length:423 start_codon:yes stop_codon:yes gene_type:complete
MIKYILKCNKDHEFESWFSDSEEFEKLKEKKLLECIYCSSKIISKSIMSPMVSNSANKVEMTEMIDKDFKKEKNKLIKLRKYIEKNFDYVGKDFSKKVREIYYDKKNKKAIYGTTTLEEREELADEGINLLSIPWVNKDN